MCKNPVSESVTGQEMRLPWTHRLDVTGGSTDKWGVGWGKKNDTLEARPSELDVWLWQLCSLLPCACAFLSLGLSLPQLSSEMTYLLTNC